MQEITPFIHGKTAWHADLPQTANPFSKDSIESEDWNAGWIKADDAAKHVAWMKCAMSRNQ